MSQNLKYWITYKRTLGSVKSAENIMTRTRVEETSLVTIGLTEEFPKELPPTESFQIVKQSVDQWMAEALTGKKEEPSVAPSQIPAGTPTLTGVDKLQWKQFKPHKGEPCGPDDAGWAHNHTLDGEPTHRELLTLLEKEGEADLDIGGIMFTVKVSGNFFNRTPAKGERRYK